MRILVACILIATAGLSLPQSARDLRSRFGEPDVERYTATNDIGLTVEYGADGLACQIVIERKQPLLHSDQGQQYMSPEVVSALIDEIVPADRRGPHVNTLLESMGCVEGRIDEYENVWIGHFSNNCIPLKPERESRATVAFTRQVCPVSRYAQRQN
jgi:hypothetical protein